jgi:hypothetical protein
MILLGTPPALQKRGNIIQTFFWGGTQKITASKDLRFTYGIGKPEQREKKLLRQIGFSRISRELNTLIPLA